MSNKFFVRQLILDFGFWFDSIKKMKLKDVSIKGLSDLFVEE
ncbi:MAG: hypothetical protein WBA07_26610 [Rivularia sp. (in: cyanobacteria)]